MICIPHTNGATTLIPTPYVNGGAPSTSHTIEESAEYLSLGVGGSIIYSGVGNNLWSFVVGVYVPFYETL